MCKNWICVTPRIQQRKKLHCFWCDNHFLDGTPWAQAQKQNEMSGITLQ